MDWPPRGGGEFLEAGLVKIDQRSRTHNMTGNDIFLVGYHPVGSTITSGNIVLY